jgi:hypothetical protein
MRITDIEQRQKAAISDLTHIAHSQLVRKWLRWQPTRF